jgi:hypothetical protein
MDEQAKNEGLHINQVLSGGPRVLWTPDSQEFFIDAEENQTIMLIAVPAPERQQSKTAGDERPVTPQQESEKASALTALQTSQGSGGVIINATPSTSFETEAVSDKFPSATTDFSESTKSSQQWKAAIIRRDGGEKTFMRECPVGSVLQLHGKEGFFLNPKGGGICHIVVWYGVKVLKTLNQDEQKESSS